MRLKHPADNGNVAILNNVSDIPDNRSWLQPPHTNASTNLNSTNYTENYQIISNYHNYRKETKSEELSTDVGVRLVCNDLYRLNSQNTINNFKETSFCIDNADGTSSVGNKCIDKTNVCSTTETPVDEEPSFEHADSDEMSEKVIHPLPRGIVNPNYPGFQHLAHTLQDYSSNIESFYQSENEMTDDDIDTELTEYTSDLIPHIADTCMEYENCNNNNNNHIPDKCKQLSTDSHTICLNSNIHSNIPDLLKTVSKTNNNCESIPNELNCSDTDIENNFNTKDIIGDFNKEIEDEIKLLLNYNISIQDDLEELRKDIQDTLAKPIENTINNISDVVNHVIKKLVETHTDSLDKGEQDIDFNNRVEYYDISDINKDNETNTRTEMNLSRPTFLLIENDTTDRITDAFLSDGKDEIHIYDNEYETENLSRNVENTIKQLSTELRKIIPKLDEMKERDRFWNGSKAEMDRYIMDTNSNAIAGSSQFSRSSESTAQEQTKEATQMKSSFPIAQSNASVQKEENSKDYDLGSFDVYNIETALPKLDLDAIENHLRAAKEAERRKRNDREEIRRRLAMGADAEEYYSLGHTDRPGKKPSLHSRLQNGKNLQICFMNETASDNESQASDVERSTNSSKSSSRTSLFSKSSYNHPYQTRPLSVNITKNDKISTVQSGAKLRPSSLSFKSNKYRSSQSLSHIELRESDFYALQATLQTEARMALAQAKEMARIQMERERRSRPVSPVTEMLRRGMQKAGAPLAPDRRRVSRQLLTDLNIAQLQVIVNELHSQIESLNDNLVKLLMARDELHMGQDSMLVDIEDLTRYLGVKEQTKKTKGTKSAVRRLTSLVHK